MDFYNDQSIRVGIPEVYRDRDDLRAIDRHMYEDFQRLVFPEIISSSQLGIHVDTAVGCDGSDRRQTHIVYGGSTADLRDKSSAWGYAYDELAEILPPDGIYGTPVGPTPDLYLRYEGDGDSDGDRDSGSGVSDEEFDEVLEGL